MSSIAVIASAVALGTVLEYRAIAYERIADAAEPRRSEVRTACLEDQIEMSRTARRVMIGSAVLDLPEHLQQARDACVSQNMLPLVLDQREASPPEALALSRKLLDEADLYVAIFAFRYGVVPEGETKSMIEIEYERAVARGIPTLIFVADRKHEVAFGDVEVGDGGLKLRELKNRIVKSRTTRVHIFRSPEEFRAEMIRGLNEYDQQRAGLSGSQQPRIFICYRREDTQDAAGRLHDRLVEAYGADRVFMDIDNVPLGADFVGYVSEQISRCSAVIVMIGKRWLTVKDKGRRRRLDNDDDLVRAEVRAALGQKNILVIPVVVQGASMPDWRKLPIDIQPLAQRNGIQLWPDQWKQGVKRLLRELSQTDQTPESN